MLYKKKFLIALTILTLLLTFCILWSTLLKPSDKQITIEGLKEVVLFMPYTGISTSDDSYRIRNSETLIDLFEFENWETGNRFEEPTGDFLVCVELSGGVRFEIYDDNVVCVIDEFTNPFVSYSHTHYYVSSALAEKIINYGKEHDE